MMRNLIDTIARALMTCATLVFVILLMLLGPSGFASAEEASYEVTSITSKDCQALAPYIGDGSADYQPGVAADGSLVAPADVEPAPVALAPHYSFTVEINPLKGANQRFSPETGMAVADVDVDPVTGAIMINGEQVPGAQNALANACARLHHTSVKLR